MQLINADTLTAMELTPEQIGVIWDLGYTDDDLDIDGDLCVTDEHWEEITYAFAQAEEDA